MTEIQIPQWREFTSELTQQDSQEAVVVTVVSTQGSAPREAGAWMAVFANKLIGTIGGGHVEFEATKQAREFLAQTNESEPFEQRYILGTNLGQCCGGVMTLCYEKYSHIGMVETPMPNDKRHQSYPNVALFGGGHVGKAIVRILGTLPMHVRWLDSRDEIFPKDIPANVVAEHSDPVQGAVNTLPPGSHVLIMSFSHAEDLDIVASCLLRQRDKGDLPFIGLIGSKTKWATFRHRLENRGYTEQELAHITCPIGVDGITGKEPEVIAVAVAAQLLHLQSAKYISR